MQYEIEIRTLARLEIIDAYDWYELQLTGLGDEFLDEIERFQRRLLTNPLTHSYFDRPVRLGNLNRFPYTVVYEVFDSTIIIYSVFMTKQHPLKKRTT